MKKTTLIFAFSALAFIGTAQYSKSWTISVNASSCMLNDDRLTLSKIALEPGFQWNERLYVGLSLAYVENSKMYNPEGVKFHGMMNSVSVSARLLKPEYKFSPLIGVEIGNIFFSNARGSRISRDFVISNGDQQEMMGTFRSFTSFARLKYMLDIQLGDLNFRLGPNFSVGTIRMIEVLKDDDYSNFLSGFGIEAGLLYAIKVKKNH